MSTSTSPSDVLRVLRDDASLPSDTDPRLSDAEVLRAFRAMTQVRVIDEAAKHLASEGKIPVHPSALGQEAVLVGAATALRERDWVFATAREALSAIVRGMPVRAYFDQLFGNGRDAAKGRQIPGAITWKAARIASVSAPLGEHLAQAAGLAWAAKTRKDDVVALAFFGDALAAVGDLHNGLNFAGVFKAPVVYVCRDLEGGLGDRGVAYGISTLRCDGTDLFAVFATVREAVEHASGGHGPIIVDCVLEHASGEGKNGHAIDPLARLGRHLGQRGLSGEEAKIRADVEAEVAQALDAASRIEKPAAETLFEDVYATVPPHLGAERDELRRSLR